MATPQMLAQAGPGQVMNPWIALRFYAGVTASARRSGTARTGGLRIGPMLQLWPARGLQSSAAQTDLTDKTVLIHRPHEELFAAD